MKNKNLYIKACLFSSLSIEFSRTHSLSSSCTNSVWTHLDAGSHTPQPFTNPTQMQQSLDSSWSNTTSWYEVYYDGSPFYNWQVRYTGPVYRKIAPNRQLHQYYRAPASKPKRNQRKKGFRKARPQTTNQLKHESSGVVSYNRSTGVNPGMSRNDASNNPGSGKVWEPRQWTD